MTAWRGVPFAAPPVGPLRFRAPVPPDPWDGVRETVEDGALPPQPRTSTLMGAGLRTPTSEDCLTLNVIAPPEARDLPVMVFIHGGAYSVGSSREVRYLGEGLVRASVIFVNINYRLGALGYLDFRFPQIAWREQHANLAKLADKLNARPSFVDTLPPTA